MFTAQLEKAQIATDQANCRSLYAEVQSDYLTNNMQTKPEYTSIDGNTFNLAGQQITLNKGTVKVTGATNGYKVVYDCTNNSGDMTWGQS